MNEEKTVYYKNIKIIILGYSFCTLNIFSQVLS